MVDNPSIQFILAFGLAGVIALAAWRFGALSRSGAFAAFVEGTIIFGLGGLAWAVLLLAFFITSSLFSRLFKNRKLVLNEKFSKGSQRDAGQVLANGGVASVVVLFHAYLPQAGWPWLVFAASLAAVNADTWATELGVLNPGLPHLITSGKPVECGTSGAISAAGTLAAFTGSLLIAVLAVLLWQGENSGEFFGNWQTNLGVITLAGLGGSLIDSLLGATVQAIYWCPNCQKETERTPYHSCGSPTTLKRGWRWLNNDWVNTSCALSGALLAVLMTQSLFR